MKKYRLKRFISLKSMFSKLIASFVLVIIIISSFHLATNLIYTHNMEQEITDNVSARFNNVVNQYEIYFNDIKEKLLMDFYVNYSYNLSTPETFNYKDFLMVNDMSKYLATHKYIYDFVVISKDYKYVLTTYGTLGEKEFFGKHYVSSYYTENFWMDELKKDFLYRIYPEKKFLCQDYFTKDYRYIVPIVQNGGQRTNSLLIAFIDFNSLANSIDPDFTNGFYIFNDKKELIYPAENIKNDRTIQEIVRKKDTPAYWKFENGYIFTYKSSDNSLIYCMYYPNSLIKKQFSETNRVLTVIILISMLVSIMLSIYIVKKFNNPVKQIYQLINKSQDASGTGRDIVDLKNIKESIAGIISQNTNYIRDIDEKNSMLKSYFYQDRLKNISLGADEPDRYLSESANYAVLLFKIHFRDNYYEKISTETSKGSYVLKDMIHIYISELLNYAVTFQIEHDLIVSIVNINKNVEALDDDINELAQKLSTEDDYVYFTIVYSRIYCNSSELHETYKKVNELLGYRKLIKRTQILSESILCKKLDRIYFADDQQKQLINLLRSGKKDECIQLIDKVFDYNVKKEINEFSIYLLYVQVVDCCMNVLMQLYNDVPSSLPLINDYSCLGQYDSVDDYKKRYENIIAECIDYIEKHQKQTDYIVDQVKNYINDNYASDITVDLLSDKLNISRTYLSRYFKNNTGVNLSDYLNVFRMKKACTMLQNSFIPVKDIAPSVGIYNISTFMRLFKSYTGKSPNDYRKSLLKQSDA